jgi:acyl carrier protein
MTTDDIRNTVLRLLTNIAPEVDPARIKLDVSFRDQLDVDSMDLLKFLVSLHMEFSVEIPERDYSKLVTPNACVAYLAAALEVNGSVPGPQS